MPNNLSRSLSEAERIQQSQRRYRCVKCGAGYPDCRLSRWVGKAQRQARNLVTGELLFGHDGKAIMIEYEVQGLGTWRCHSSQCKGDKTNVEVVYLSNAKHSRRNVAVTIEPVLEAVLHA